MLPDAASYNIYYASVSGVTPLTGTKISNVVPPYTHTGLTNGTTYYYVVTAVVNETEGIASRQVSAQPAVGGIASVDITPVTLSAPASGGVSSQVEVTWVVQNQGTGEATPSWYDSLYFSSDDIWDNQDMQLIAPQWSFPVGVGQSYTQTLLISLPQVPAGTYYLVLRTDSNESIYEADEANNVLAQAIALTTPDFTPVTLSAPASGGVSSQVEVTWVVQNQGTGEATPSWYDSLYFSSDDIWDNQDMQLIAPQWSFPVGVGQSYTQTLLISLPQVPAGTYYLVLRTDSNESIYEADEANNVLAQAIALTTPDLTPVTLSAPASGGVSSQVEVTWVVQNQGTGEATPSWYDSLYFSSDDIWDNQDMQLIAPQWSFPVGVGQSYTQTLLISLPQVPAGTYYLVLRTDSNESIYEADEANNVLAQAIALTTPDLIPVTLSAPASGGASSQVEVTWVVQNQGTGEATPAWYDSLYFSSDDIWDNQDMQLIAPQWSFPVGVGESYTQTLLISLPQVPAGTYYLVLRTDSNESIYEADEANNVLAQAIALTTPDLTPVTLSAPASGGVSSQVEVTWVVQNQGTGEATPAWYDSLYFSSDDIWDNQDMQLIAPQWSFPVGVGESYTQTLLISLPQVPAGTYYLVLRTDSNESIYEADEANNVLAQAIALTTPDLIPVTLSAPASGGVSSQVEVTWVVQNQGTGEATPSWYDSLYFSTNETWDNQDIQLIAPQWTYSVASGQSYTQTHLVSLPQVPTGTYYLVLQADGNESIYEESETNNALAQAIALGTPDLVPVQIIAPPNVVSAQQIELSWIVQNRGAGTPQVSWSDRLYLSANESWDDEDILIESFWQQSALAASSTYTHTQRITLPTVSPGTFYLILKADNDGNLYETNEANNELKKPIEFIAVEAMNIPWRTLSDDLNNLGSLGSLDFSANGSDLVVASGSQALVWNVQTGNRQSQFTAHTASIDTVDFAPGTSQVLSGRGDGTSRIWDAASRRQIRTFAAVANQPNPTVYSADGSKILSASGLGLPRLWDTLTGKELQTFSGLVDTVTSVALSPDSSTALAGSADGTAMLWNTKTGDRLLRVSEHTGSITSVVFSPDGAHFLTASVDGTVRLWDTTSGVQTHGYILGRTVIAATFSRDGEYVLFSDDGWPGTLYTWDVNLGTIVRTFSEIEDNSAELTASRSHQIKP